MEGGGIYRKFLVDSRVRVKVSFNFLTSKFAQTMFFLISLFVSLCIFEGIDECIIYKIYQTDRLS